MTPSELEQYLHDHIPLSRAMQVSALAVSADSVVLSAPLKPNINHRDTVFGGSAAALATLAAWSLLQVRLNQQGATFRLVIQRNTMEFLAPMSGEFIATSALQAANSWERQLRMLQRKGVARFKVAAELHCAGEHTGSFSGEFVALAPEI
ncbi:MAG TPA: YiiD C-terminal domain-containing protein [Xanthomonadales bacterium]|nr:YiiD C-terminal domain-containing protein [Xanthomonadales bacterium]